MEKFTDHILNLRLNLIMSSGKFNLPNLPDHEWMYYESDTAYVYGFIITLCVDAYPSREAAHYYLNDVNLRFLFEEKIKMKVRHRLKWWKFPSFHISRHNNIIKV